MKLSVNEWQLTTVLPYTFSKGFCIYYGSSDFLLFIMLNSYTILVFIYTKLFPKTLFTVEQWCLENILGQNSLQGIFAFGHLMLLK